MASIKAVGCLALFYHSKWNKRDCKTLRTIYREGNTQLALRRKTSPTLGEGVETTTSLKEGFFTTRNAPEKRLEQVQTNSQELQNGGCVSRVRRKWRGSRSHAMGEQLGITLEGIKSWRRFVSGFIGETWLRRFENMWRSAHSVRWWMPISSSRTRSFIPSLFSQKFGARWADILNVLFLASVFVMFILAFCWPSYS